MRVCVKCGEPYVLTSNKPGYINECADCGADDVALVGVPEHLLAVCDSVEAGQLSEMKEYGGSY